MPAMTPPGIRGLQLFARYAYPPNELGYCGPDDHEALFGYASTGTTDRGLVQLASGFVGPWPYLTLMAGALGLDNPFDLRLVEAYWIGNDLLDRVTISQFGRMVEDTFKPVAGDDFPLLAETVGSGAMATHSFHVYGVYPWVGLLRRGEIDEPLRQLDRCRIRWGRVEALEADRVEVRSRPLTFDGLHLGLGDWQIETAVRAVDGTGLAADLAVGDWVSLHWHWVCEQLDERRLHNLVAYHQHHLDLVNHGVAHSGPGMVMAGG